MEAVTRFVMTLLDHSIVRAINLDLNLGLLCWSVQVR